MTYEVGIFEKLVDKGLSGCSKVVAVCRGIYPYLGGLWE